MNSNSKDNVSPPLHKAVRTELLEIQQYGGAMIKPFALYEIVSLILNEDEKVKLGVTQIRMIVETYCALCNEFYIIYCFEKNPKAEFFVSEERWEKYFITSESRTFALAFLQKHGFIHCTEKVDTNTSAMVTTYQIDLAQLQNCRRAAEELYEKSKAKKRKFLA